ncbi:MAG: hypothetical protein V4563_05020 [Pseudomonadota bacterium]
MKLEKLLAQQVALTKAIEDERKAVIQSKKNAVSKAAERAGLFGYDADVLLREFQKVAKSLASGNTESAPISPAHATQTPANNFEQGD